jgi:serine/threonine-protein kinase
VRRNGEYDDARREDRGSRWWPWLLALLVLLLIGGGVTAYLLTRPATASVPTVVNEKISVAQANVVNFGFTPAVIYEPSSKPSNVVIAQTPLGGARADKGSTVTLTVSSGPGQASVPSVIQLSEKVARRQIEQQGLKVARVLSESSTTVAKGLATRTDPPAGTLLPQGTGLTLYVSSGKAAVPLPDVTGETESAAKSQLTGDGFTVTTSPQPSSSQPVGTVISQSPAGGTTLAPGSAVSLVIATAPTTASVPPVVGDTAAAATSTLRGAGFTVNKKTQDVAKQNQDGNVISQSPAAGGTANKGSAVTIVVGHYTPTATTTTTTTTPTPTTSTTSTIG